MTHPSDEYPIIIAYPFVSERSSTSAIYYIIVHFYSNVNTDLFSAPNHIAILTVFLVRWRCGSAENAATSKIPVLIIVPAGGGLAIC